MKKLIALLLCLASVVSVLAGCGGGGGLIANDGKEETIGTVDKSQELPDDLTLTIGLPVNANVEDYDTNAYTLWLEEVTGYDLKFVTFQPNAADYKAQLSAMMATNDPLPDILYNFSLGSKAYTEYGESGYFIDLAPYYNDKELSANFWERMEVLKELDPEQYDYVLRDLNYGGNMYAFAQIEYSLIDTMKYQTYINQDWLDILGMKMPTNTQELYNTLVAFRDYDFNGNGRQDEKPLIGYSSNILHWIVNMFCYVDNDTFFNVDENGQLYLPHLTNEYREALIFINKLIDEKLMYDSSVSFGSKEVKSLMTIPANEVNTVGIVVGHPTLIFQPGNAGIYSYEALPYWGNCVRSPQLYSPAVYVTSNCEYPLAAWNLLMAMCTQEGGFRQRYGEYGEDYTDADPGTKSFIGLDAEIKVLNEDAFAGKNNSNWHKIMGTILIQAENETVQMATDEWTSHKMTIMGNCYFNYVDGEENNNPDAKYVMPKLVVPPEVSEADSNEKSNSAAVIDEAFKSFCLGTGDYNDPSNDAQWAKYIAEVEAQGYKTWMANRQVIFEAQFPNYGK